MPSIVKRAYGITYSFDEIGDILIEHAKKHIYMVEELGEDFLIEEVTLDGRGGFFLKIT